MQDMLGIRETDGVAGRSLHILKAVPKYKVSAACGNKY